MSVKRYDWNTGDESATGEHVMHKDYAALETLCQQQHEALEMAFDEFDNRYDGAPDSRVLWMGEPMDAARNALTAYAALFPKTGGA